MIIAFRRNPLARDFRFNGDHPGRLRPTTGPLVSSAGFM
jgi:hypothetical protein